MDKKISAMHNKCQALNGMHNSHLDVVEQKNNLCTDPLCDTGVVINKEHLTQPAKEDIQHAKDWVDNGSIL